jgi:hypothetical protein
MTLHEDRCTFLIISRSVLFRKKNFSDESYTKIQNTVSYSIISFDKLADYEMMWGKYCRAGQTANDNAAHAYCTQDT